jgi:hypothetical protein
MPEVKTLGTAARGVVAKDPTSPYVGGTLKVKQPRYREGERG